MLLPRTSPHVMFPIFWALKRTLMHTVTTGVLYAVFLAMPPFILLPEKASKSEIGRVALKCPSYVLSQPFNLPLQQGMNSCM